MIKPRDFEIVPSRIKGWWNIKRIESEHIYFCNSRGHLIKFETKRIAKAFLYGYIYAQKEWDL